MTPHLSSRFLFMYMFEVTTWSDFVLSFKNWKTGEINPTWDQVGRTACLYSQHLDWGPDPICWLEIQAELRQDIITNAFNLPGNNITHATANIYISQSYAMKTMRSSGSSTHPVPALQTNHWLDLHHTSVTSGPRHLSSPILLYVFYNPIVLSVV